MFELPDRVSVDTRRHYAAQDRAAAEYADSLEQRRWEALEALSEPQAIEAVIGENASPLALPLADAFTHLERAVQGDRVATDAVLQAVFRMQQKIFGWLMERE